MEFFHLAYFDSFSDLKEISSKFKSQKTKISVFQKVNKGEKLEKKSEYLLSRSKLWSERTHMVEWFRPNRSHWG